MYIIYAGLIPPLLHLDDETVYFVPSFNYHGSLLSHDNSPLLEISRRHCFGTERYAQDFLAAPQHLKSYQETHQQRFRDISPSLRGRDLAAKPDPRSSNGFDSRALRRIEGIHWDRNVPRFPPNHPTWILDDSNPAASGWRRPRGARGPAGETPSHPTQAWYHYSPSATLTEVIAQALLKWRNLVLLFGSTRPGRTTIE